MIIAAYYVLLLLGFGAIVFMKQQRDLRAARAEVERLRALSKQQHGYFKQMVLAWLKLARHLELPNAERVANQLATQEVHDLLERVEGDGE